MGHLVDEAKRRRERIGFCAAGAVVQRGGKVHGGPDGRGPLLGDLLEAIKLLIRSGGNASAITDIPAATTSCSGYFFDF